MVRKLVEPANKGFQIEHGCDIEFGLLRVPVKGVLILQGLEGDAVDGMAFVRAGVDVGIGADVLDGGGLVQF